MKTIFISGATAGFGAAMTARFIKNGNQVIATGRRIERLEELKKLYGEKIHTIVLDIRNASDVEKAIAILPTQFKNIDVLINNAGLALGVDSAQNAKLSDWETVIDTNINGVINCTHALLPEMVKKNNGHIINLGSVAGEFPYPGGNVYGATKAFVHQFTLNLKADLIGTNVRVTCIEPGMCETEFSAVRFSGDQQKAQDVYKGMTPLSADDIAETIEWVMNRPAHVNINTISLMPTAQAFGAFAIDRGRA